MIDLIRERLDSYTATNQLEEEHAVKEILQEITLYGLWRSGFFDLAAFQGGTCLRILHGLNRFSEDLDFILKVPDPDFSWPVYLDGLLDCFSEFGLKSEIQDKGRLEQRIQKALIKDNAICNQLNLSFFRGHSGRKFRIKLEIDVVPPEKSQFEWSYLDFPLDFEACHQDLPSNFSLKIHALLCRPFIKGRDWFDFCWYVKKNIVPNFPHLKAALHQWGPWEQQEINIDQQWLQQALTAKINEIDWHEAARDVAPFLSSQEQRSLSLWQPSFFQHKVSCLPEQ